MWYTQTHTPFTPLWLSVCCASKCGCVFLIMWLLAQQDQGPTEHQCPPSASRLHVKQCLLCHVRWVVGISLPSFLATFSIKSNTNEFSLLSSEAARTWSHICWCIAAGQFFTHGRNHGRCETFPPTEEWIFQQTIPWMSDWTTWSCFIASVYRAG